VREEEWGLSDQGWETLGSDQAEVGKVRFGGLVTRVFRERKENGMAAYRS